MLRFEAVAFEVADPGPVAAFWAGLLGRPTVEEPDGILLPGDETQVGLRFVPGRSGPGRPWLHLHLTSATPDDQRRIVDTALRLGARHLDVGQTAADPHVVLADPGGNELCVIEPGNGYLAGTGVLGEVTCAGSRAVGLFWRDALGWPLVWDEGDQTAIQSPLGGTKLAWDVWVGERGPQRQRFDLVATDPEAETVRLRDLGALDGHRDPDGTAFTIRRPRRSP
jgi:hypothetical protein